MPLVATWLDLVVGVDFHMVLLPTPVGPVPSPPLPHPHVGMLGDPAGMVVSIAASSLVSICTGKAPAPPGIVLVNHMPVVTTADLSKNTPLLPHIPMPPGTAFVKPPQGKGALHLGSTFTAAGGSSIVRLGELVFTCSDPIPMPTSAVVTIPKGAPVIDNAPPGFNPLQAASNFLVGKVVRTAFGAAGRAFKFLGRHLGPRLRNWLDKTVCFFTGHPVNIVTGCVVTDEVDFELPGPLPLRFERSYSSGWAHRDGPLGWGWSHSLDRAVWMERAGVVARLGDGREIVFDTSEFHRGVVPAKRELYDHVTGYALTRLPQGKWRLVHPDGIVEEFAPVPGEVPDINDRRRGLARVVRTTRRNGKIGWAYQYDELARLASVTDSGGRVVKFEHAADGRLRRIHLPHPELANEWDPSVEYAYSAAGDLVEVRDALKHGTRYGYGSHLLCEEIQKNGISFFWGYDGRSSNARCIRTWGEDQHGAVIFNQKLYYDPQGRKTVVSDSYGNKTLYAYNELNLVTEIRDPHGKVTKREYDDNLHLKAVTDPLGNQTRQTFDHIGRPNWTFLPDGARTLQKYHPRYPELVTLFRDENENIWKREYDSRGQITRERGPDLSARREYEWREGLLVAIEEPGGHRTTFEYDRAKNLTLTRFPRGGEQRTEYDRRGRVTASVSPSGGRTEVTYDACDRPVLMKFPDGNLRTIAYDAAGNVVEAKDKLRSVRLTYANFNKLTAREEGGETERCAWGAEGELVEVRNAKGHAYQLAYDPCLRVAEVVDFDRQRTAYRRDAAGRVVSEKTALGTTTYAYDAADRVTEITYPDGTAAAFKYRDDGLVVEAKNATCTVVMERDALGRVVEERQGDTWVKSSYHLGDFAGLNSSLGARMALLRDADGNAEKVYLGDPTGRRSEISFKRDGAGLEIERLLPGNVVSRWNHDVAGRPTSHLVGPASSSDEPFLASAPSQHWSQEYLWSFDDRLTTLIDTRFGAVSFDHDERGRLIAEHLGSSVALRLADNAGNLYRTRDGADRSYAIGGRIREAEVNGRRERFAFNAGGFMTARWTSESDRTAYRWDGAGMLVAVERPDGTKVEYAYDALGRRVRKKAGEHETRWVWAGNVVLHEVRAGAGGAEASEHQVVTWYHDDTMAPLARFEGDKRHHVVVDHLGTPAALYDEAGRLAWQMQLDLFGVPRAGQGSASDAAPPLLCPWRWPGQQADEETGLYYNRFRHYDPKLGQYISKDPLFPESGLLAFGYAEDPLVWADPFGLVVVYHYTSRAGYNGIRAGRGKSPGNWWWFRAAEPAVGHPRGVYVTPLPPEHPKLAAKLRISARKTEYYFKMDVPDGALKRLEGGRGVHVMYVAGDMDVPPGKQLGHGCRK